MGYIEIGNVLSFSSFRSLRERNEKDSIVSYADELLNLHT